MNYALMLNPSLIRPFVLKWKFNMKAFGMAGFALVFALIGFYIFQISAVTQVSFTVVDYEKKIAQLDKEFKNLQLNFSDASSLSGLEEALVARGYEKVGKIHYIQVLDSAVAAK
jgi:hypothetical protein